jgi:hypothetical protein
MTSVKGRGTSHGLMAGNTSESGRMESSMEWEHILQKRVVAGMESGRMERRSDGSIENNVH